MARSFEIILMGRFLYGISAGLCLNIHGPYLGEISPKKFRGLTTTTAAIFFSLGKALGQILGLRRMRKEGGGYEDGCLKGKLSLKKLVSPQNNQSGAGLGRCVVQTFDWPGLRKSWRW
uniref:Major facilitator superfamily (MFS) profile domain-containing protein n=1 Tax=Naja naja TaxID=35670 RepID=A0A8C6YF81_NAJNA